MGDVCEINPKNSTLPNSFVYIDLESVIDGVLIKENKITSYEAPSRAQRILRSEDILFQMVRPYQKNNFFFNLSGNYVASTGYAQIRTIQNPRFIFQYLHNQKFVDKVIERCTGTSYPAINSTDLSEINLSVPLMDEQEKISSFLFSIDKRIQTQRKIIEQLETLMKGNLEKIFRQKLRFKNKQGNYFSIWKTMKLDEICDIKKGEQLNKEDLTESGNYPCLNGGMSFSGYTDKFNSDENTITISEGGNSCGFINFMKSKFWLGGHCYKVILKKDISKDFLFHLLKFYEREIMNLRVGSGLPNIQQKDLKNLQLLISEDIEEQNKIANFLSSIQDKVETEKQILEKLELQKKFLLGNLFV
ncbi:restriction endonuclease subunit S [Elizabethkingia anophelis]|uniref:restriction endonuclease subunit S n=1 Tax=Elizabethkingia anophelis TaxID=1117645 RepID=UPI003891E874